MIAEKDFKHAMAQWASGISVITTLDGAGAPVGFTATSLSSVSLNPPMILFCLSEKSGVFQAFKNASGFIVNILGAEHQAWSQRFAGAQEDRFNGVPTKPGLEGFPLLDGAIATLECQTKATYPGGDHLIFLGEVLRVGSRKGAPLLYYSGGYHHL